jgi:hypothetical protein
LSVQVSESCFLQENEIRIKQEENASSKDKFFLKLFEILIYSGASVHELNPFLEAVREPKSSRDVY